MKIVTAAAALTLALAVSACGFRPIYATAQGDSPVSRIVRVDSIAAPDTVAPYLSDALDARLGAVNDETPRYTLYVTAREGAERLAVQLDATVTRYNYRLSANYTVVDNETDETFKGVARAVTSYNIVNSQYSTLYAERAAVEKAARQLAEEIERDLLIRLSETPEERARNDPESYDTVIDSAVILTEPRRGEVVEPLFTTPSDDAAAPPEDAGPPEDDAANPEEE